MGTEFKDEIEGLIDKRSQAYTDISDAIWGFAEPRFQERESSRIQQEYLSSRGFSVRADLAGEETAFIAEYGSGKPVIAFLGEFDALPNLSQKANLTRKEVIKEDACGHGCGALPHRRKRKRSRLRSSSSGNGLGSSGRRLKNVYGGA